MPTNILLVDAFDPWRRLTCSMVAKKRELKIIGEVVDGLTAVRKAIQLKPELVLLEISLPSLNGIEAARKIRQASPTTKAIFLSADNSLELVQAALGTGAQGFVHKAQAASNLLPVIAGVLPRERSVTSTVKLIRSISNDIKQDERVTSLKDSFDIFAGIPDRDAVWLETVFGVREARERMQEIATSSTGTYFVFHSRSHAIVARLDTSLIVGQEQSHRRPTGTD